MRIHEFEKHGWNTDRKVLNRHDLEDMIFCTWKIKYMLRISSIISFNFDNSSRIRIKVAWIKIRII